MNGLRAVVVALALVGAGKMAGAQTSCGLVEQACDCAALVAVLDGTEDEGREQAMGRLRERAGDFRNSVITYWGDSLGHRLIEERIDHWSSLDNNVENTVRLAVALAECHRLVGGARLNVLVVP